MKHVQQLHQVPHQWPRKWMGVPFILAACAALAVPGGNFSAGDSTAPAASPGDNVSFFVIGKTWHFQQDSSGLHGPNDVHYFAEIFSKAGGRVSDGNMRPLETPNPLVDPGKPSASSLTYTATSITVPGAGLTPGMSYHLEVEFAKLVDTDRREGVVGMSTYAATTHLAIQTEGEVKPGACPEPDEA